MRRVSLQDPAGAVQIGLPAPCG